MTTEVEYRQKMKYDLRSLVWKFEYPLSLKALSDLGPMDEHDCSFSSSVNVGFNTLTKKQRPKLTSLNRKYEYQKVYLSMDKVFVH